MIGLALTALLAAAPARAIDTPTIPTDTVDTNKIKDGSVDTRKLMNTAHRVQSLGINRAGGLAIGSNALSVNGVADFVGVDASSVTASTVTAHVLSVLGPATINTQGSSTTVKGILLVDASTLTVTLAPGGATLFRVNTQDGVRIATNAVVTGVLTIDGSSMTIAANSTALSNHSLTVRGGGATGAFGFLVEANGGDDILRTDAVTYNVVMGEVTGRLGVGTGNPGTKLHMSSGTLTVDGTSALIKIGDAAATPTPGQLIASPPTSETIAAGGVITANACGGLKMITAAGNVTTDLTNTLTAPAAANAGCCMTIYNQAGGVTITLDQNANNTLAVDTALGPCDSITACSQGAGGRWVFGALIAGTCNL